MYNPQNVLHCEEEKRIHQRKYIDSIMTLIGAIASFSSVPQVIKIIQTGDVSGISVITQLTAFSVVVIWFFYGLYIHNKPLAITSGISSLVLGIVVIQLFVY